MWRAVLGQGGSPPEVPWSVTAVLVLIAGIVLWLGLAVRAYQRGDTPDLDPIRAARTAALAKAASFAGSLLSGWYGAQVLCSPRTSRTSPCAVALSAGAATLAAVVLAVVGMIVERFCRLLHPRTASRRGAGKPRVRRATVDRRGPVAGW